MIEQVPEGQVAGFFEPVATLSRDARTALEAVGVEFLEETGDFGEPGPTQWAVAALSDERRYLLVHHYAHPASFVELRASTDEPSADEAVAAFVEAVGLAEDDVLWIVAASDWPPRHA
jgi:hypothetical protein